MPVTLLNLGAMTAAPKNLRASKSGVEFGLRRPLSARGKTPRSPRLARSTMTNKEHPSYLSGVAASAYALPVVRAASLRTGRGTRLKRIEDIDQMAKAFRNTVEAERNFIISAAESRASAMGGPVDDSSQSHVLRTERHATIGVNVAPLASNEDLTDADIVNSPRAGVLSTGRASQKIASGAGVVLNNGKKTKLKTRSRHRSLKEALAFSRKEDEKDSVLSLSPTASEDSRSTVTDASPSPMSGLHSKSPSSSHESSSAKELAPTPSGSRDEVGNHEAFKNDASGSWSKKLLPVSQTAVKKTTLTTNNNRASAYRSASGRNRTGFGTFRVPKTAKRFVRTHLESEQKQLDNQARPSAQRLSKK